MEEELKPCPNCGHIPERHDWGSAPDGWSGHYYCTECNVAGPSVRGDREAMVAAWNALPRRLRWTKEQPTENGWFFHRDVDKHGGSYTTVLYWDKNFMMDSGEWAGPIPEPEDV